MLLVAAIVMRSRVWRGRILYCNKTFRATKHCVHFLLLTVTVSLGAINGFSCSSFSNIPSPFGWHFCNQKVSISRVVSLDRNEATIELRSGRLSQLITHSETHLSILTALFKDLFDKLGRIFICTKHIGACLEY